MVAGVEDLSLLTIMPTENQSSEGQVIGASAIANTNASAKMLE